MLGRLGWNRKQDECVMGDISYSDSPFSVTSTIEKNIVVHIARALLRTDWVRKVTYVPRANSTHRETNDSRLLRISRSDTAKNGVQSNDSIKYNRTV